MLTFLDRYPVATVALPETAGEVAGISYRIRGAGPPLVLIPLMLAPAQWEPLLPTLTAHYCTISLGGPRLGVVGLLEARGRSAYLTVVRNVLDVAAIQPGETVLEVGGGSGVVLREIARRTGASRIVDVDISPYLLREAAALADQAGFTGRMEFREGSAEAIPLADDSVDVALSFTVLEEGDADRMLAELVRVTRPGGRVAVIVRAIDMPAWVSMSLGAEILAKVEHQRGMANGGAAGGMRRQNSLPPPAHRRIDRADLLPAICRPEPGRDSPADDRQAAHPRVIDRGRSTRMAGRRRPCRGRRNVVHRRGLPLRRGHQTSLRTAPQPAAAIGSENLTKPDIRDVSARGD
jgi:SAM-dependent methyltransferase